MAGGAYFGVDNGIPVNGLRRQTVQRSLRHLLIDRVKSEHDPDDGTEKPDEGRKRIDIAARRREQLQEQKLRNSRLAVRGLLRRLREGRNRPVHGKNHDAGQQDKQNLVSRRIQMV